MSAGVKRYRIRLEVRDGAELEAVIGHRLEPEGMWMKLGNPPALDTLVEVIVHFGDGREALVGSGWVSEHSEHETHFELEWVDGAEPGLADRLFKRTIEDRPALTLDDLESPDEVELVPSAGPGASGHRLHPDLVWDLARGSGEGAEAPTLRPTGEDDEDLIDPTRLDTPALDLGGHAGFHEASTDFEPSFEAEGPTPTGSDGLGVGLDVGCSVIEVGRAAGGFPQRLRDRAFPALVGLSEHGELVTGAAALELAKRAPERVVTELKRFVGLSARAPGLRRASQRLPWKLVEGPRGRAAAELDERIFPLEDLLARVVEDAVGEVPGAAAVVVPSWYGPNQRGAMVEAVRKAGLEPRRVISCCLAAAVHAYPEGSAEPKRVLAIDLGAGSLDVAMVEIDGGEHTVLASGGDAFLGGVEFDAAVAQLLMRAMESEHPPEGEGLSIGELLGTAEGGKFALDEVSRVHLAVTREQAEIEVARRDAEALWGTLIDRAVGIAKDVVLRSGINPNGIHELLLSGGQVRSPYVVRRFEQAFERPCQVADAPGAAALGGAGIAAGIGGGDVMDALPCSVQIQRPGDGCLVLAGRDAPFPAFGAVTLELAPDEPLVLTLLEGEASQASENTPIARAYLASLPEHRMAPITLEIQGTLSGAGDIELEVVRADTGSEVEVQIGRDLQGPVASPPPSTGSSSDSESTSAGFLDWVRRKLRR